MSVSVADAIAALQQAGIDIPMPKASGNSVPKAQKPLAELPTIPKEWPVGWEIIRLLNSKRFNHDEVVITGAIKDREGGEVATQPNGEPITFGDLATVVEGGAINRDGKAVNDYPMVWALTWPEAKGARDWLRQQPDKPKASGAPKGQRKNAAKPQAATPQPAEGGGLQIADVVQLLSQLGVINLDEPAKPVPAKGHRKVEPAKPVEVEPEAVLAEGDIVAVAGTEGAWEVVIHANGRPSFRRPTA